MFRYLYSYKLEEVGQAVCNAFIGQWFLLGIQAAARNCTELHSLHHTSTPCRPQAGFTTVPISNHRFTVWQMVLPSTASFIPVINHLTVGKRICVANSFLAVESSQNASGLENVDENAAAELEDCIRWLHLSCDKRNCSRKQPAELSFCDEAAVILPTPQMSTCTGNCAVDSSCAEYSFLSCSCSACSSYQVSSAVYAVCTQTVDNECEPDGVSSPLRGQTVHLTTKKQTESSELFDGADDSHKCVTKAEKFSLNNDCTPEILFCSVTNTPGISPVQIKRNLSFSTSESHSGCATCDFSDDSMCYSDNNCTDLTLNSEDNYCTDTSLLPNGLI